MNEEVAAVPTDETALLGAESQPSGALAPIKN